MIASRPGKLNKDFPVPPLIKHNTNSACKLDCAYRTDGVHI